MSIWYMDMRETICLVTNWYPTRENPYMGVFFREQALALSSEYNFIVLHIKENRSISFSKHFDIKETNKEQNIIEYDISIDVPIYLYALEAFYNLYKKHVDKKIIYGVGRFVYPRRIDFIKQTLKKYLWIIVLISLIICIALMRKLRHSCCY